MQIKHYLISNKYINSKKKHVSETGICTIVLISQWGDNKNFYWYSL